MDSWFPPWAWEYLPARRYKIAYGGRGAGRSWAFARMALLRAATAPVRVLCCRELQNSIKESVHHLLCSQVDRLGFGPVFEYGQSYLRGRNGSEFIFKGLRYDPMEIKSMEDVDICWVEEAQSVSRDSWDLLIPTIRKAGSEIWATFNPDQETDPTYQRFVLNPPPGALVRKVGWQDNPWLSDELEQERLWMLETDQQRYDWVWGGNCRSFADNQILSGKWVVQEFTPGQDWDGPYYGADWGFSEDPSTLVKLWTHERNLYVEREGYGVGIELDQLPGLYDSILDRRSRLVRADSSRPESIGYMRRSGYSVIGARKGPGSVEDGIEHLRSYRRIIIHPRCTHTQFEARNWCYKLDKGGNVMPIVVDAHNHCWDAIRYALEPKMKGYDQGGPVGLKVSGL